MFKAYWNKNVFREIYLIFFPKIKRKFKRKHAGKYNGIKAPGKFKFSEKKSHKMLNVVRFKQVQTHAQTWWYTQCATVSDSTLWFWSKIKGRKRSVLLTWVKISGILVVVFTMQKCSWIIWTLHGLLLFGRLPLINPLAATKHTLLSLTIIVAMLHKVSTNSELEDTGLLQEKMQGLVLRNLYLHFVKQWWHDFLSGELLY